MLSRKDQKKPGILLPENWRNKIEGILYKVYKKQCEAHHKNFQVHGLTYPDEFFLAVGLFDPEHLEQAPVSYIVSMDLDEKNNDPEKVLDTIIDSMGVFFDTYFNDADWNDYISVWTEATYKDISFYYIISRENIALTIQAEALLNQ